jgi:hypothetical protein
VRWSESEMGEEAERVEGGSGGGGRGWAQRESGRGVRRLGFRRPFILSNRVGSKWDFVFGCCHCKVALALTSHRVALLRLAVTPRHR